MIACEGFSEVGLGHLDDAAKSNSTSWSMVVGSELEETILPPSNNKLINCCRQKWSAKQLEDVDDKLRGLSERVKKWQSSSSAREAENDWWYSVVFCKILNEYEDKPTLKKEAFAILDKIVRLERLLSKKFWWLSRRIDIMQAGNLPVLQTLREKLEITSMAASTEIIWAKLKHDLLMSTSI